MTGIYDYSTTDASNTSVGGVSIAEGMARASVNNAIRAFMGDVAQFLLDIGGAVATTGSSNAYAVTLNSVPTALANNLYFLVKFNHTNTGASTLNPNTLGNTDLKKKVAGAATALAAGDAPSGGVGFITYSSADTAFILHNPANPLIGTGTITSAQLAAALTDETGSGAAVFATSPTLVTPVLGVAAATSIDLGATDTTLSRASAGDLQIETNIIYRAGGTDVPVADGGTGASTATAGFDALSPVTTRGDIIIRDASNNVRLAIGTANKVLKSDGTDPAWGFPHETIAIACSDETTAITAATDKIKFRMPYAFTVSSVRASLSTTQTSGNIFTVDIHESGTTILSTKITIDNGEKTSTTAVTAPVISDTALADDAEITIDVDQIGDGTAKGLKVYIIGLRA